MNIHILTMFPEMFTGFLCSPIIKRALDKKIININLIDIKDFALGSYRHIDDSPCGGGAGMIIKIDVITKALESCQKPESKTVLLTPIGKQYNQSEAVRLTHEKELILICGHYEGIDARIESKVNDMINIGDYVLSGGEIAAMAVTDSIVRLLPNILRDESTIEESFNENLLEYPQYTKPISFQNESVPDILLSGHHEKIRKWRRKKSLERTKKYRPDLFEKHQLTKEDIDLLKEPDTE